MSRLFIDLFQSTAIVHVSEHDLNSDLVYALSLPYVVQDYGVQQFIYTGRYQVRINQFLFLVKNIIRINSSYMGNLLVNITENFSNHKFR
jgi:hypothetical protein